LCCLLITHMHIIMLLVSIFLIKSLFCASPLQCSRDFLRT
jgi:hypothetical protein